MAKDIEPTNDANTEVPGNPVLDLQNEDSDEVEAHLMGNCISVLSVVEDKGE
jgi:hypothetical protein